MSSVLLRLGSRDDRRNIGSWLVADLALPELFVRQIPHRLPLVGPYSLGRGLSHPSPAFFYLAYIPTASPGWAQTYDLTLVDWYLLPADMASVAVASYELVAGADGVPFVADPPARSGEGENADGRCAGIGTGTPRCPRRHSGRHHVKRSGRAAVAALMPRVRDVLDPHDAVVVSAASPPSTGRPTLVARSRAVPGFLERAAPIGIWLLRSDAAPVTRRSGR